ncbi:DNA polymerase III subunit epsilon [Microvirga tunisiensis]|uniref:DNA polymerase III subunit epsilon n=1 Tax=Microvirga tunisiensis TaxID=2108360 RepID=A0A5N7MEF0_9HYPH|nr:DNA polymerase III subunit epsilon [Microvirga tunisiensis]MPR07041.1 DNA polymerase III subunit epsilon [Microvirga tunisiensis]MPR25332.1 DNA polymerase III subunit epsilon [Microvirga tunisiensis]
MLREIVLDTETTGTDHAKGDRVIEIGCVELLNHIPTGKSYHVYINPECPVSPGAFAVHGLSDEFLKDKPVFAAIADEFAEFVRDARLVIHNAAFDIGFLNAEFARTGHTRFNLPDAVDTLSMARRKHPGAANNLDALCTRYGIDNSRRTKHGALLDAEILAEVYIELIGGQQVGFDLSLRPAARGRAAARGQIAAQDARPRTLISRLTEAERAAHEAFIQSLGPNTLWREYLGETTPEAS